MKSLHVTSAAVTLLFLPLVLIAQPDSDHPGATVYETRCAICHDGSNPRAASVDALRSFSRETLSYTLTAGVMSAQGQALSDDQRSAVVDFLAADELSTTWISESLCSADQRQPVFDGPIVPFAGVDAQFTRHLTAAQGGLEKADLANLEVAWAIGLPGVSGLRSAPVFAGNTLFYPAAVTGQLLAIDADSGCIRWAYDAGAPLRASAAMADSLADGRRPIIITDEYTRVHAVDAYSGEIIWRVPGAYEPYAATRLTGAPLAVGRQIVVPVSASGSSRAADPNYECCEGRGAVLVLDAATGERLWSWATVPPSEYTGALSPVGVRLRGPSGAPVWSNPTFDEKRGLLYVTTGENSSLPTTGTSDAIIALDIVTGEPQWTFQALANDAWNMACTGTAAGPNCPSAELSLRADADFGGSAVLVTLPDGTDRLLAGQKSGHLWALNPDDGSVVWQHRVGVGGSLGGNHWGVAVDDSRVFMTINDPLSGSRTAEQSMAGVYAYDIASGEPLWAYRATPDCGNGRDERVSRCNYRYGFSALPLVVDGAVVAGSIDGRLFIIDGETGELIYQLDTTKHFSTMNGVDARGGSIDSHSVAAGAGMIFVGSGYARFGQQEGNLLLALRPARLIPPPAE